MLASSVERITVFGGTGMTGRLVVELALKRGNRVTALVRTRAKLGELADKVDVIEGDATDPVAVDKAVAGSGAVLSALGHVKGSPRDLETAALRKIVASMKKSNVRRLVVLSSSVVADPSDKPTLGQRLASWLVKAFRSEVYHDSLAKALVVRDSGLEWTIVRASILTNGPPTGRYRVGRMGSGAGVRVSRADAADFMLKCATGGEHSLESPYISG